MTPTIHRKSSIREFLLRALLIAALGASALLAHFASSRREAAEGFACDGIRRVRFFQDSDAHDLEYWQDTISNPLPLKQISGIHRESRFLDLQPFRADSYPSGKVSDVHLATVAKSPWLEELRLGETCITDDGIRHLTALRSLRVLRLSRTAVSDRALAHLASLTKLEMLDLDHTQVTDKGVSQLATLGALRVLQLGKTKISDAALADIAKLAALEDVYLHNDQVSDLGLRYLARLPKLEYLDLRATRVTDEGIETLRQFPALEIVRLDGCPISDYGILFLSGLKSLELVDLYGAKGVTAAGVERLKELRPDLTVCWEKPHKKGRRGPN